MTFDEYFKKKVNTYTDYDGIYGVTCFDLANDYCANVLSGKAFVGKYAWEIYAKFDNQPSKNLFTRIANTPEFVPQKGDIIIWAQSLNGDAGHVAICNGEGDITWFKSYEQNWTGNGDRCTLIKHNYNHVLGVLRPKDQTNIIETKGETKMSNTYYGVDVSEHNGSVDMNKVKASGKNFVIIRSSYGNVALYPNQKDKQFESNVQKAKSAGLDFGIFHYSYATTVSAAQAEAKGFVALLDKIKPIPYFVALDIEEKDQYNLSTSTLQSIIKAFIDIVEGAGYFCALYSYNDFLNKLSVDFRKKYAIWCANTVKTPTIDYGVHQYSFKGKVNGINGDVDLDKTAIDYPTIIKNAGLNGYKKTTATETTTTTTTTTTEIKTLDSAGFKKGDKGYQALALKSLLKLAVDQKIVEGKMDDTSGIGNGCIKVINALLKKWGYKQTGIAGTNFINKLYKELK